MRQKEPFIDVPGFFEERNNVLQNYSYSGRMFHYTDYSSAKSICQSHTFWMHNIYDMEDELEGASIVGMVADIADDMHDKGLLTDELHDYVHSYEEDKTGYGYYIACFSKNQDDEYMWDAYADSSEGCCIVLDTKDAIPDRKFMNVIYREEEKERLIRDLLTVVNGCMNQDPDFYYFHLDHICGTLRYFFKSPEYEEENEVRIILEHPISEEIKDPFPHQTLEVCSRFDSLIIGSCCEVDRSTIDRDFGHLGCDIRMAE